ncbi:MAG: iron ABC transporter permease [Chloroflexi bacterium]|nr:iron ABC transporter permease [Chloroflexota bacterium]
MYARLSHTYGVLKGRWHERSIFLALVLPLGFLVAVPLLLLLLSSFRDIGFGEVRFNLDKLTLDNYVAAYTHPRAWRMLWDSFVFASGSLVVAFLLGGGMAFLVERTDAPFRRLSYAVMFVPLITPGLAMTIAWILLLSPKIGFINQLWFGLGFEAPLVNAYSMPALWWVQGILEAPLVFLLLGAALRRMDPALEEAAIASGAPWSRVATRITARLMIPAIVGVALLQFVRGLETLDVPLIMGLGGDIRVFSSNIMLFLRVRVPPSYGLGFTYAIVLIALTAIGVYIYQRVMRRTERYTVVTGKGYRPRIIELGRWKAVAVAFQMFFAFAVIGLPLAVLVYTSLLGFYQPPSMEVLSQLSLNSYQRIFSQPTTLGMLKNTAVLATLTSMGTMLFSLLLSWVIFRMKIKGGQIIDGLAFIPYAIPGIALAVAFMVMFLAFPNPIYGTIWILVIAYIVRSLPYGTRFTHAGLVQIHKELEEAGKVSGASFGTVFFRIIVPVMKPTLIGGGLYVFIQSVKIFAIAAILFSPSSMVFVVHLYQTWAEGAMGDAAALAVIMIGVISVLTFLGGGMRGMGRIAG